MNSYEVEIKTPAGRKYKTTIWAESYIDVQRKITNDYGTGNACKIRIVQPEG